MKWMFLAISTATAQNMFSEAPRGGVVFEDGAPAGGRYTLVANQAGRSSAPLEVALPAGETRDDLLLLLSARARLRGRVSGLPEDRLAGVEVIASGPGVFLAATRTGADGRFALTGLPEGRLDLRATVRGPSSALRTAATHVLIAAGQVEAEAELVFGARYAFPGTVPLGEAGVELDANMRRLPLHATTDSSGQCDCGDLESSEYVMTGAVPATNSRKEAPPASKAVGPVVIDLQRGEGLGLRARDGLLGVPLRNAFVRVSDAAGAAVFTGGVKLDSDGRGEIPSLRPGAYTLAIAAPGHAPARIAASVPSGTLEIALTPGGSLEIRSGPETLATRPSARIFAEDGTPCPLPPLWRETRALEAPLTWVEHLAPGRYTLAVGALRPRAFTVKEGGTSVVALP